MEQHWVLDDIQCSDIRIISQMEKVGSVHSFKCSSSFRVIDLVKFELAVAKQSLYLCVSHIYTALKSRLLNISHGSY